MLDSDNFEDQVLVRFQCCGSMASSSRSHHGRPLRAVFGGQLSITPLGNGQIFLYGFFQLALDWFAFGQKRYKRRPRPSNVPM